MAGFRSMSATAILSNELSQMPEGLLEESPLRHLQAGPVALGLKFLAASEIAGDKLPDIPDRIGVPSLLMRTAAGALVGATIFTANHDTTWKGAALGGLAAVAATFGSFYLRKALNQNAQLPNAVSGALEDVIAVASGLVIAKS